MCIPLTTAATIIDPSIGLASIDQQIIDRAVKDIQHYASPVYAEAINDLTSNPEKYQPPRLPTQNLEKGHLQIPREIHAARENRYFIKLTYQINELVKDSFPGNFLLPLYQNLQILLHDFKHQKDVNKVEFRFEKGFMVSLAERWHHDRNGASFTISYSTKKNWSTVILAETDRALLFDNSSEPESETEIDRKIESRATITKSGHFYDVHRTLHRSPMKSDLNDENIDINDHRLFVRFYV